MADRRIAVIDIGSNSGRVVVITTGRDSHLEIVADARTPLRLVNEIDDHGRLTEVAYERTRVALFDFLAIATSARADHVVAAATAAVREAANGTEFCARLNAETGLDIRILDGEDEARLAFTGAVHGLPVEDGLMVDVGGGSLEVCGFRGRRLVRTWTLPLGALRLTDTFLNADPPRSSEVARLRGHAIEALTDAGIPRLHPGEHLVGTGGTVRNLAKLIRARAPYLVPRIHGYVLDADEVHKLASTLLGRSSSRRTAIPGLSADRADSIAGGALMVEIFVDAVGAKEILVSGQGLREGLAFDELGGSLPATGAVREASVMSLVRRFTTWDGERAHRRRRLAARLLDLLPVADAPGLHELLDHAATIVDIGRSIDYYSRWSHAAAIVRSADLRGFSHRSIALLAAMIEHAGSDRTDGRVYRALLSAEDRAAIAPGATILLLADEIEQRTSPGRSLDIGRRDRKKVTTLSVPIDHEWTSADVMKRFRRAFGNDLVIEPTPATRPGDATRRR